MKLILIREVIQITGVSRSYIYALSSRGEFPKPVKLTSRSSAWVESEIQVNWSNRNGHFNERQ